MTRITHPVTVEVFAHEGCDAAAETVAAFEAAGVTVTTRPWHQAPLGYHISPAVWVYVGEGSTRHPRYSWSGNRADLLAHAIQLAHANNKEEAAA